MDEPTCSLTARETERLFAVIRDLRRDGVSILYISHRLAEVREIADRVTVLRDGRNAGELAAARNLVTRARAADGRPRRQAVLRAQSPASDSPSLSPSRKRQ